MEVLSTPIDRQIAGAEPISKVIAPSMAGYFYDFAKNHVFFG
jgi:hypothetical protein